MRMIVWTKRQVIAFLVALVGVTVAVTLLIVGQASSSQEEAVSAFAAGGMFEQDAVEVVGQQPSPSVSTVRPGAVGATTQTSQVENTPALPGTIQPTVEATPAPTLDTSLHVEIIRDETPASAAAVSKSILIYHTHTWEAYEQVESAPYAETEKWRTKDNNANVVAVGNALTASLRALGYDVVHDTTAFEPPTLDNAYERSLTMLEERLKRGESYDLYIDLHRDAYVSGSGIAQTVSVGNAKLARLMLLIGKGTGTSFAVKPDWEENYTLAESITAALNEQQEGLCRSISLKSGRFNQHIAPHCVLLECGNNRNTLEEVLASVPYLAQALKTALETQPNP